MLAAFLGGISKNYRSNLLLSDNTFLVAEADEYDRSFFAIISANSTDYLGRCGPLGYLRIPQGGQRSFCTVRCANCTGGSLVLKKGVKLPLSLPRTISCFTYHYDTPCDIFTPLVITLAKEASFRLTWYCGTPLLKDCQLGIPGRINVENAVGAAALAYLNGVSAKAIKEALSSFRGVARRMDVQYHTKRYCYIDDYAHHPREIQAAVQSVRKWFPREKITGIFQPHLYSGPGILHVNLLEAWTYDRVILMPVYPARELPIPGVGAEMIAEYLSVEKKEILDATQVIEYIKKFKPRVLVTLGAGNIDRLVQPIRECLKEMDV